MSAKSGRPIYAIVLLVISALYLCGTWGYFLHTTIFPNEDIQRVVAALKEGGVPPMEADTQVEQAKAAVGYQTRAIHVGSGFGSAIGIHLSGSQTPDRTTVSEALYLMWFQKRPRPTLVAIAVYQNDAGQKAYRFTEVSYGGWIRMYLVPLLFFGGSCFLARPRRL